MEAKVLETIDKEKLYTDYHDMVLGYIMHHIGNLDVAEDLCSDVFVKAYSALDRFDPAKASVSTWLYTIMRNTLTDYYRRNTMTDEIPEEVLETDISTGEMPEEVSAEEILPEQTGELEPDSAYGSDQKILSPVIYPSADGKYNPQAA